jgi:hypothetical protein
MFFTRRLSDYIVATWGYLDDVAHFGFFLLDIDLYFISYCNRIGEFELSQSEFAYNAAR